MQEGAPVPRRWGHGHRWLAGFCPPLKGLAFGAVAKGLLVGGGPGTLFATGGGCEAQLPEVPGGVDGAARDGAVATPEVGTIVGGPGDGSCSFPPDSKTWLM